MIPLSLPTFLFLKKNDVYDTLKLNQKGVATALKNAKVKKGFQQGKVTIMKWKNKEDVSLLSTGHLFQMATVDSG